MAVCWLSARTCSLLPRFCSGRALARLFVLPARENYDDLQTDSLPGTPPTYNLNTMALSDAELTALLDDLESDCAERKQSWSDDAADKGCQAVCAFANDLPNHQRPGVLFVGAKDDGEPSGLKITDELLITLADVRSSGNIVPPPSVIVEKRTLKGSEMAVVMVLPADAPPVRYKGRTWVRIGPRRGIATAQDERILNEKRRYRDLPFDICPLPSASFDELNRTVFETEYLPKAFAPDVVAANDRNYDQKLAACRMIASVEDATPTVLGVLTIGQTPRTWLACAYVQFLRIAGANWGDEIVDEETIDGTLSMVLRRLDDKLKAHLTTSVDITSASTERRSSSYPLSALQQLTRNAVMHRTYENTNAPIRVYWFNDRIEIHSPGGPFGVVTAENFGKPGITDYRNPHIAEAMRVLGYVQRFGVGIATAQRTLAENGNPPAEFVVQPNFILATIKVSK
jgi:ATP-dependent DNA helicase RecG